VALGLEAFSDLLLLLSLLACSAPGHVTMVGGSKAGLLAAAAAALSVPLGGSSNANHAA
jgi:hypothetical protein